VHFPCVGDGAFLKLGDRRTVAQHVPVELDEVFADQISADPLDRESVQLLVAFRFAECRHAATSTGMSTAHALISLKRRLQVDLVQFGVGEAERDIAICVFGDEAVVALLDPPQKLIARSTASDFFAASIRLPMRRSVVAIVPR
jgi:hypothetical protein